MSHLTGADRARYVQGMFGRIAGRYDVMNRLMTGGQDVRWRRYVIDLARLPSGGRLLDLGTGTGDLAFEALRRDPTLRPVGGDFTLEQLERAHIERVLTRTSSLEEAAHLLGIDGSTLYRKRRRFAGG